MMNASEAPHTRMCVDVMVMDYLFVMLETRWRTYVENKMVDIRRKQDGVYQL